MIYSVCCALTNSPVISLSTDFESVDFDFYYN